MKVRKVGRLTLGVLLVSYGLILIFSKLLKFSAAAFIGKWWPLTFIILGLEILLSGNFKKDETETNRTSFDGWSVFFIIVILLVSFGIDCGQKINRGYPFSLKIDMPYFNTNYKNEDVYEKEFKIDSAGKQKLLVINEFGNVRVSKGEGKEISIKANIKIRNNDGEFAKKVSDSVVKITDESTLKVESDIQKYLEDRTKISGINVNYTILIPEGIEVEINNKYGNVSAADITKNTTIGCTHGEISVDSVKGNLETRNSYGDIDVSNVLGDTKIYNRNGNIDVKGVNSLKIENEYADITVKDVKSNAEITNKNGNIKLDNVGGNAVIDTKYSEVDVINVSGSLRLSDENGNISIKDIGKGINIENKYGNISIINPKDSVTISDKNGNITLESSEALKGNVDIVNEYGDIDLSIPKSQEGNFSIYTKYGNINSSLNLNIKKDTNEESIEQKIGNKNTNINIRNRNGSISIK